MMMAKKPSGGGLNVTLHNGDNGQLGIDVYNYLIEHGIPNEAGGYDWESTEMDNLLITGEGLVNQRVDHATKDGWDDMFYFFWAGMDGYWVIQLEPSGTLWIDYDN